MALHNEILAGRFSKMLTKLLSMKGGAPAPQISSEFSCQLPYFLGVENRAIEGWYRYGIEGIQPAVAAQLGGVRLRNPAASNRIVVFEKIAIGNFGPAAQFYSVETQTTNVDLAGAVVIGSNASWDKRLNVASGLILSIAAPAAALSLGRQNVGVATIGTQDVIIEEQQQIVLSPGEAIQIRSLLTVNQEVDVALWWRERFLEESEQTA